MIPAKKVDIKVEDRNKISVLHIDDETSFLDLSKIFLTKIGTSIDIQTVSSSIYALKLLESHNFDVVVSDYQMPGMNGLELLAELRKWGNDVPFIILTGKGKEEVVIQALNLGADYYLQKSSNFKVLFTELYHFILQAIDRKRAEEALRKERDRAQKYLDIAAVLILAIDRQERIILVNKKGCEVLGCSEEEVIGKNWFENFIPKSEREHKRRIFARLLKGEIELLESAEGVIIAENGEEKTVSWNTTVIKDEIGTIVGTISSGEDITARKLIKSDLQTLFDTIEDFLFILDEKGNILHVSPAAENQLKYEWKELAGKSIIEMHPADSREEAIQIIADILAGKTSVYSIPLISKERKLIPVETKVTRGKWRGTNALIAISRDITERKRAKEELRGSEEKYRRLVENSGEGITIADLNENFIFANPAFHEILGVPTGQLVGRNAAEFISPETLKMVKNQTKIRITGKTSTYEVEIIRRDKSKRQLLLTAAPHFNGTGTIIGTLSIVRDITDRKRVMEELEASEERYRHIVENTGEGIGAVDLDENILFANPVAHKIFGLPVGKLVGRNLREFLSPEMVELIRIQTDMRITGKKSTYELEITRPDTTKCHVLVTATPHLDNDGNIIGGFAILRDITERKRVMEEVRKREEQLRAIFSNTTVGVGVVNTNGQYIQVNDRWAEILGYHPEEIYKLTHIDVTHPEDREISGKQLQALVRGDINQYRLEKRFMRKDGSFFWGELSVSPIKDTEGTVTSIVGMIVDITERKQAEKKEQERKHRYQALFESSNDAVFIINLDEVIIAVNQQAAVMLGYTTDELVGMRVKEVVAGVEYADSKRVLETLITGKPVPVYERKFRKRDGSVFPVEINVALVTDSQGKPLHIQSIVRDITERKNAEMALKQQKEEMELYLSIITHDLSNHLLIVKGYLDLILKNSSDPSNLIDFAQKSITALTGATTLMQNISILMKQYLSYTYELNPVNVLQSINKVSNTIVDEIFPGKKIEINNQIPPQLFVVGDSLLEQLFLNLIINAVKNDYHETVELDIKAEWKKESKSCIISLTDHGKGIPPERRPGLFERFTEFRKKGQGSGLGLFIVKTLVDRYQGKIWIEDRIPGDHTSGTCFKIELPTS
ncbi:MAG: PAS domain S-box protein [Candidatus Odinarchaeota archaeon]